MSGQLLGGHVQTGQWPYATRTHGVTDPAAMALSTPSKKFPDEATAGAKPGSAPARAQAQTQRPRPEGFVAGHTVQDWEQPPAMPALARAAPAQPAAPESSDDGPLADASPPTTPLYLRAAPRQTASATKGVARSAVAFDAKAQTLTAQSAALVDALTRGLSEALALQLRPVVASTVDMLIPMILSLGNTPNSDSVEPAEEEVVPSVGGSKPPVAQDKGEVAGDAPGA
ncbi:MAG: hypothetical protein ACYC2H_05310 [Thermoplasmatota archaeon]